VSVDVATSELRAKCQRNDLARAVSVVGRVASTAGSVQVLTGVLVSANEGVISIAATDMQLAARMRVDAIVEQEGRIVVPARLLQDIVRSLPDEDVYLDEKAGGRTLQLKCGSATFSLRTFSPDDFPQLPDPQGAARFEVDAQRFIATANRVARAASRDESRPVLRGVLVKIDGNRLTVVGTDAYRLALQETQVESTASEFDAIVPARGLQELARIGGSADRIEVATTPNHVMFTVGDIWLMSRKIDGVFPDHSQLIPQEFAYNVLLPRRELLEVVTRIAVMAQRNSPLRMHFEAGEATVSVETPDVGEATDTLPILFDQEPLTIGFNATFVREGLEAVEADELYFRAINPLRPVILSAPDDGFTYLIMPIRLPD
jgi:DNA polymerase-3 subunit beta